MTRRSERELERAVETLERAEDAELSAFLWAELKAYYGGELTPAGHRLLAAPEDRLRHYMRLADGEEGLR